MRIDDIRLPSPSRDDAALLALNNAHAVETSRLDAERLTQLLTQAFYAANIDRDAALLIAVDQSAAYDSPNFLWFQARLPRFIYVDRIIVSQRARGQGLARLLYSDLFAAARRAGHSHVVCEVNVDPPNPASDAFHAALGFTELGRTLLANGKTVRYLTRSLKTLTD